MEQGDFRDVERQVLNLCIIRAIHDSHLQEVVDRGMTDGPAQSLQHMPLHLDEHVIVVKRAAHRLELLDGRNTILLVTILGSNEQSRTPDQLVVSLVDDTFRAVSVEQVNGQEESRRQQLKGGMGFNQEIEQVGTHEPLNLGLDIDRLNVREGGGLLKVKISHNHFTTSQVTTDIHVQHVRQNVITELFAGDLGKFIRNGILTLSGNQSRMLLWFHARGREVVIRLHKEGIARLIARGRTLLIGHIVGLVVIITIRMISVKSGSDRWSCLSGNDGVQRVTVVELGVGINERN